MEDRGDDLPRIIYQKKDKLHLNLTSSLISLALILTQ